MRLVIERATSRGRGSGNGGGRGSDGGMGGSGGTSRPFQVTSSLSAASIKIRFAWRGSFDQFEGAAQI